MFQKTFPAVFMLSLLMSGMPANAQEPPENSENIKRNSRFWEATLAGGHYMVALDRISSVSRHKYLLDGAVIVDEVTIDTVGQALARFYFITPITESATGSAAGAAAAKITERGQELIDRAAQAAGTEAHRMVIKKFPETTHAHTIEYRILSEEELTALYESVRNAWESGRGRKFSAK
jgi:hypothetical protein